MVDSLEDNYFSILDFFICIKNLLNALQNKKKKQNYYYLIYFNKMHLFAITEYQVI
jgi:hypothetical protein